MKADNRRRLWAELGAALCTSLIASQAAPVSNLTDDDPLRMPTPGSYQLRILTPTLLELTRINTKLPDPARVDSWDLIDAQLVFQPPSLAIFAVTADPLVPIPVLGVGFKRRPLYAPLRQRDLRIGNQLYLQLGMPVPDNQTVSVRDLSGSLWSTNAPYTATSNPRRFNPALHVNQTGYTPGFPKKAMVGYYLGSLGEMNVPAAGGFQIIDAASGATVHQGALTPRPDQGYIYSPTPYQKVYEARFDDFNTPGEYKLLVPGMGTSFPFVMHDGVAICLARTYALGLYHQRCGTNNTLPYTRHTHGSCHTAPADVPTMAFTNTQFFIAQDSSSYTNNPRHVAPQLKDVDSSLYPFVTQGKINVSGGHHDAGDYSKYTVNCAMLIHHLVFTADAFPGAGALDNLGLPESRDGRSDLLQEAKWEADFLARMQDADGGFYFLVYPRNRRYENNVLPDQGDPQIVWPKNTAATAAAVAALAQCASSPQFKQQFPIEAALYLQKAQLGWHFLTNALAHFGKDGAYQRITHYGDEFMHDDELAWAASEMFLATGDEAYHQKLFEWFPNPSDPATRRWGWWRLFASYGCAIRSYAFGARSGRVQTNALDAAYLLKCELQIEAAGRDALKWSEQNAYGSSFPEETKRVRGAGWYFSGAQAFDLAVAYQLDYPQLNDPRPKFLDAILLNLNYEAGCNPVNVAYVTGLGSRRQREIVHQYAQNDRRVLPPSGIPLGNIQASFDYLDPYKSELGALCFPLDGVAVAPHPFYDRWGDSFNVSTEFTVAELSRALGAASLLAALTPLKTQLWNSGSASIVGLPVKTSTNIPVTATLQLPGLDLSEARVVWEARDQEPAFGTNFTFAAPGYGTQWVEAEAVWPDGRRIVAVTNFFATNGLPTARVEATIPTITEASLAPGEFTIHLADNTNSALTVFYRLSGTATKFSDYRRPQGDMPDSVLIPAGVSSFAIPVLAVNDPTVEGPETAVLTLLTNASYNVETPESASLTINDNDVGIVGIEASDSGSVSLTWTSTAGKYYNVEYKNTIVDVLWNLLAGNILAQGPYTVWLDESTQSAQSRFYRVLELP